MDKTLKSFNAVDLIREVRKYPQLYDQTVDGFQNIEAKEIIWKNIATVLGTNEDRASEKSALYFKEKWFKLMSTNSPNIIPKGNSTLNPQFTNKKSEILHKTLDNKESEKLPFCVKMEKEDLQDIIFDEDDIISRPNSCPSPDVKEDSGDNKFGVQIDKHSKSMHYLIKMIKSHPEIYDERNPEYANSFERARAWHSITKNMCGNCDRKTVYRLKLKWKNLRHNFYKSVKSYEKKVEVGMCAQTPKYFEELQFILPHVKFNRKQKGLREEESMDASGEESLSSQPQDPLNEVVDMIELNETEWEPTPEISNSSRMNNDNSIPLDFKDDEIGTFFRSVEQTVRRLSPLNQALIKKTIINVVMDMDIKELEKL